MENFYITFHNEWKQWGKKFNWYTFTFFHLSFENEPYTGGVELMFMILGLGFTARYNYDWENSKVGMSIKELDEKIDEILDDEKTTK